MRVKFERRAQHPEMEERLHSEYKEGSKGERMVVLPAR